MAGIVSRTATAEQRRRVQGALQEAVLKLAAAQELARGLEGEDGLVQLSFATRLQALAWGRPERGAGVQTPGRRRD